MNDISTYDKMLDYHMYHLRSPEEDILVTVLTSIIIRNTDIHRHTHAHHTQVHAQHPTHAHTHTLSPLPSSRASPPPHTHTARKREPVLNKTFVKWLALEIICVPNF